MMVRYAAIYARISNDPEGDRLGVNRQVEDCRKEAERRGWPVADLYVDDDKSAWSGKVRPEYQRLVVDIDAHRIDAVLFWHPDRLTRIPIEMEQFAEVCRRNAVEVAWMGGELAPRDSDGLLLLRILSAVASDSSAKTSKRIKRKNEERAAQGLPTGGGTRPFGYRADRVTVDPVEAALVREAVDRVFAGDSVRAIAGDWIARGIPTAAGKRWTVETLRRMLYAARLSAQREHLGEIVAPGKWEAIITPEETARLRAILDERTRTRTRPVRRYLLSGLLRCALCDAPLIARPQSGGDRRYVCAKGPGHSGCGRMAIMADPIEAFLSAAVLVQLDAPAVAAALAAATSADAATAAEHDGLRQDREQLDELARAYGERRVTFSEWLAARAPIEARIDAAQRKVSRMSRSAAVDPYVGKSDALRAVWPTLPLNRQRSIVSALLDRAVIRSAVPGRTSFDADRIDPVWRA
jgi:DNA invertase Pin-like site-specific DNA recombinase